MVADKFSVLRAIDTAFAEFKELKPQIKDFKDADALRNVTLKNIELGEKILVHFYNDGTKKQEQLVAIQKIKPLIIDEDGVEKLRTYCIKSIEMNERLIAKMKRA